MSKKVKNALELADAMNGTVPNDAEFQADFAVASVSQAFLARYYLRALERYAKGEQEPEWIPNSEESINLEHVMPQTIIDGWDGIDQNIAEGHYRRLGNLVLMQAKKNVLIGNKGFEEKKAVLQASGYVLTREVGETAVWDAKAINERQLRLAELAVKTWPVTTSKPTKGGKLPKTV